MLLTVYSVRPMYTGGSSPRGPRLSAGPGSCSSCAWNSASEYPGLSSNRCSRSPRCGSTAYTRVFLEPMRMAPSRVRLGLVSTRSTVVTGRRSISGLPPLALGGFRMNSDPSVPGMTNEGAPSGPMLTGVRLDDSSGAPLLKLHSGSPELGSSAVTPPSSVPTSTRLPSSSV